MSRARRAALIAFALVSTAFAGFSWRDVPPPLHGGQGRTLGSAPRGVHAGKTSARHASPPPPAALPRLSFSAPVLAVVAVDQAGQALDVALDAPLDLSQPLPAPPGAVDLELILGGPINVWVEDGRGLRTRTLEVSTLVVALEDPDATAELDQVLVDLEPLALVDAADDEQALALLQDGAVAVPW